MPWYRRGMREKERDLEVLSDAKDYTASEVRNKRMMTLIYEILRLFFWGMQVRTDTPTHTHSLNIFNTDFL